MKYSIVMVLLTLGVSSCEQDNPADDTAKQLEASIQALKAAEKSAAARIDTPQADDGPSLLNVAEAECDAERLVFDAAAGKKIPVTRSGGNAGFKVAAADISWSCGELPSKTQLGCAPATNYVAIQRTPGASRFKALCYQMR